MPGEVSKQVILSRNSGSTGTTKNQVVNRLSTVLREGPEFPKNHCMKTSAVSYNSKIYSLSIKPAPLSSPLPSGEDKGEWDVTGGHPHPLPLPPAGEGNGATSAI